MTTKPISDNPFDEDTPAVKLLCFHGDEYGGVSSKEIWFTANKHVTLLEDDIDSYPGAMKRADGLYRVLDHAGFFDFPFKEWEKLKTITDAADLISEYEALGVAIFKKFLEGTENGPTEAEAIMMNYFISTTPPMTAKDIEAAGETTCVKCDGVTYVFNIPENWYREDMK